MNILVLLAGVIDPKWPASPSDAGLPERPADRLILSPFDETALEIALKIRDARPETTIRAVVAGGEPATKLARTICALNVADVATIDLPALWDQAAVARELARVCGEVGLVLIGREFGDCDDGLVPPMLAGLLGYAYFGRVQAVETSAGVQLLRENGAHEERLLLDKPLLASATNDRRSRLRKPLLKNVMTARQATIRAIKPADAIDGGVRLVSTRALATTRTPLHCELIEGPLQKQAERLASLLLEAQP
ncbi:MAG: hypothetical protein KDE21_05820 [Novosphingobium sp.]|nr:hypothetical protein [Novosphingobium sp.]